jgi:ABC-2 type transport system permease protein
MTLPTPAATWNPHSRFAGKAHLDFPGLVSSEWLKARTMASSWICCILYLGMMGGIGLLMGISTVGHGDPGDPAFITLNTMDSMDAMFGVFFPILVSVYAALIVTSEYGSGQIRSTLTTAPRRTSLLLAKTVVASAISVVLCAVAMIGAVGVCQIILSASGYEFNMQAVMGRLFAQMLFYALVCTWMAVGLGAMLRSSAAAIGAGIGIQIGLPIIMQLVIGSTGYRWAVHVFNVLPSNIGSSILQVDVNFPYGGLWGGNAILLAWGVVFLAGGLAVMNRRDA